MRKTPLLDALNEYNYTNPSRFHTPSHKANAEFLGFPKSFLEYDVTELPLTGSLFDGIGATAGAEEMATQFFKTKATRFSAGGCTLCIQAMFKLISGRGTKVICSRQVHKSAVNAMALLGLEPVWIFNKVGPNSLPKPINPIEIKQILENEKEVAGIYITSPDYYGTLTDIFSISKIAKDFGIPVLVDNAHGTHLWFSKNKLHPIPCGATMSADSAHKTLPVLTGGAFLQINSDEYVDQARQAMSLFGSTSPSYPIMLSLDLARGWLEDNALSAYNRLEEDVKGICEFAKLLGFGLSDNVCDPMRITLNTAVVGYSGPDIAQMLREEHVEIEYCDKNWIVLIPSPFNTQEDFKRLRDALSKIKPIESLSFPCDVIIDKPRKILSLRQALLGKHLIVDTKDSVGMVVADTLCPCPPGIPVVMPGEEITETAMRVLISSGITKIKIVSKI